MDYCVKAHKQLDNYMLSIIREFIPFSSVPTMNIDHEFIQLYNRYLLKNWNPLFIEVTKDNKTIGLVPLMYLNKRRKGIIPYRRMRFFGSLSSDFCDIYAKNENEKAEVIKVAFNWLFGQSFRWEEMVLDDLLEETGIVKPLEGYLNDNRVKFELEKGKYFHINLERSWEEIEQGMSNSFVWKNVRLAKNRITNSGRWEIHYNPELNADEIMKKVKPIHSSRQDSLGRDSSFIDSSVMQFYSELIDAYIKRKQFNTFWLLFEDRIIAYMLGFYLNNVFYWWNTAFLPEYKEFYPTRLLQYHALEYMHGNAYREFNFMRGESDYKDKWTNTTRTNYRFRIYNNKSIYGKALLGVEKLIAGG